VSVFKITGDSQSRKNTWTDLRENRNRKKNNEKNNKKEYKPKPRLCCPKNFQSQLVQIKSKKLEKNESRNTTMVLA